jgi:hypothetical protein
MDAKVRAIRAELLRRDGQLDRLLQDVARGPHRRLARWVPMPKGKKADLLHEKKSTGAEKSRLLTPPIIRYRQAGGLRQARVNRLVWPAAAKGLRRQVIEPQPGGAL